MQPNRSKRSDLRSSPAELIATKRRRSRCSGSIDWEAQRCYGEPRIINELQRRCGRASAPTMPSGMPMYCPHKFMSPHTRGRLTIVAHTRSPAADAVYAHEGSERGFCAQSDTNGDK